MLHPASLPGPFGIGELGTAAETLLRLLGRAGIPSWVVPSSAEDVILLSFELLRCDGAFARGDLALLPQLEPRPADIATIREVRLAFLDLAARRFVAQCEASPLLRHALDRFCDLEADWLHDCALHAALARDQNDRAWHLWPTPLSARTPSALDAAMVSLAVQIEEQQALRYLLHRQWRRLRAIAADNGVQIQVLASASQAPDSADAWIGERPANSAARLVSLIGPVVGALPGLDPEYVTADEVISSSADAELREFLKLCTH